MSDNALLIEQTVRRYIDGISDTNIPLMQSAFHQEAVMTGHFGGTYMVVQKAGEFIADYMRSIPPTSRHSPNYAANIAGLEQFGTLARVTLEENQLEGKDMRAVLILHKVDGDWLIASKGTWAPD